MKTPLLGILVSGCVIGAFGVWYLTSYDFTPITKENTLGINALVVYNHISTCPNGDDACYSDHYLKITSRSNTFLLGYNICDGNSCVKQDGLAISLPISNSIPPDYQKVRLPELYWKDGDLINIQVKVPTSFTSNSTLPFDSSDAQKTWVDLGKSEIVRSS
ncbi:MAG TPA: hypothetical protein VFW99_03025 [Candidatus Nitrosotalea sp.]|nr:hypothetical protein [Candidatus Nitrosotalea sp.]